MLFERVRLCVHMEELINGQDIVGESKVEGLENNKETNKAFTLKLVSYIIINANWLLIITADQ